MKRKATDHAALRFQAPGNIQHGVPLKEMIGRDLIRLISESFANVLPKFDQRRFIRFAEEGLDDLELSERGKQIRLALAEQLPKAFGVACPLLFAQDDFRSPWCSGFRGILLKFVAQQFSPLSSKGIRPKIVQWPNSFGTFVIVRSFSG